MHENTISSPAVQEDFLPQRDAEALLPVARFRQVLSAWVPSLVAELEFCTNLLDSCQHPGTPPPPSLALLHYVPIHPVFHTQDPHSKSFFDTSSQYQNASCKERELRILIPTDNCIVSAIPGFRLSFRQY